jgi:hypothetical protein
MDRSDNIYSMDFIFADNHRQEEITNKKTPSNQCNPLGVFLCLKIRYCCVILHPKWEANCSFDITISDLDSLNRRRSCSEN